jgi:hypothetical protein
VNLLMRGQELPFAMREIEATGSKRRIAAAVAELIADGEAVGLDSGPPVIGHLSAWASVPVALGLLPLLTAFVVVGTLSSRALRRHDQGDMAVATPITLSSG